ncbi:MAG: MBL fold metallo-hydrolase [Thermoflavifilum sp.]|nr:MBL fold metallo-hydrolase [Thermoflavifilum sp.]
MKIQQFEDINLSHYSYALLSDGEMVVIDPSRDPHPYYAFAEAHQAKITAIIETHPHADFVSSHLEIHQSTKAPIYVHSSLGARYPHHAIDEGDTIQVGQAKLKILHTPGHSPDSISIVAHDGASTPVAVFTGDTLFIGDCGRPDLREKAGNIQMNREKLARQMFHSLREKLMPLPNDVLVYPAHGAGSLCGRGLSKAAHSTIGAEKMSNWSLQPMSEDQFVERLLENQPFVPAYFPFDVEINRKGAKPLQESLSQITRIKQQPNENSLDQDVIIIDTRSENLFKQGHLPHSINLMEDTRFETWLGTLVEPNQPFYLGVGSLDEADKFLYRIAKIGYENQIKAVFPITHGRLRIPKLDIQTFKANLKNYTIVDVRDATEVSERKIFPQAIHIPLNELYQRRNELPTDKPIAVHCAGGFRSAAATSILAPYFQDKTTVYDIGIAIKDF